MPTRFALQMIPHDTLHASHLSAGRKSIQSITHLRTAPGPSLGPPRGWVHGAPSSAPSRSAAAAGGRPARAPRPPPTATPGPAPPGAPLAPQSRAALKTVQPGAPTAAAAGRAGRSRRRLRAGRHQHQSAAVQLGLHEHLHFVAVFRVVLLTHNCLVGKFERASILVTRFPSTQERCGVHRQVASNAECPHPCICAAQHARKTYAVQTTQPKKHS